MFAIGSLNKKFLNAHRVAIDIQKSLVYMLQPSVECQSVYEKSLEMAVGAGLSEHYMGLGKDAVRFVGHGIGLKLDEFPVFAKGIDMKLEPGMTFALEPKFVFPDGAIGVENTFLMKDDGVERLTLSPEEIVLV